MAHGDEKSSETIEGLRSELETPKRFSPEQLEKFTTGFFTKLGSGAFGDVFKGVLHDGVQVAVKVLKEEILSDGVKDQFKAEVSVLGKTYHKHVVKLYGFCFEQNMIALVYEFMENGSLDNYLYGNQSIAWETLCNIAVGIAKGLAYLHEDSQSRILHYDIKPANILLDSKFSPKVGDFGLAKLLNPGKTHFTESRFRGTPNYAAPELGMPYSTVNEKCDVFSFGILLFDIIGRRPHVSGDGEKWFPVQVWKKFKIDKQEEIMHECNIHGMNREQAKRILLIALQCVQFLPVDRPSMSHVVRLLEGPEEVKLPPNPFLIHMDSSSAVTESVRQEDNISRATLGPWGSREGYRWDDGIFPGIKKIKVYKGITGDLLAIQVWYCGKHGESISIRKHGTCQSDGIETVIYSHIILALVSRVIEMDYPSEYLMRVTGFYGYGLGNNGLLCVRSLCFISNKRSYKPVGFEGGEYFTSKNDGKDGEIVGFHGREGLFLNAIGIHMEYNKDRQIEIIGSIPGYIAVFSYIIFNNSRR